MQSTTHPVIRFFVVVLLVTGMVACGETDGENGDNQDPNNEQNKFDPDDYDIEVAGIWESDFGEERIDDDQWDFMEMIDFDNDERWAITQNPEDDDFHPEKYAHIVWTPLEDDTFYYCIGALGLDTEEEARQAEVVADEDDLDEGCGEDGFAWTKLERL